MAGEGVWPNCWHGPGQGESVQCLRNGSTASYKCGDWGCDICQCPWSNMTLQVLLVSYQKFLMCRDTSAAWTLLVTPHRHQATFIRRRLRRKAQRERMKWQSRMSQRSLSDGGLLLRAMLLLWKQDIILRVYVYIYIYNTWCLDCHPVSCLVYILFVSPLHISSAYMYFLFGWLGLMHQLTIFCSIVGEVGMGDRGQN